MILEEKRLAARGAELVVERSRISFVDLSEDKVRIFVTVHNAGETTSAPTLLGLESAPLGAFVPWKRLAVLLAPPLEPGESIQLSTDVGRPRPIPVGDFSRVPPFQILTALISPDQPEPDPSLPDKLFKPWNKKSRPATRTWGWSTLAPNLSDFFGQGRPHWAGNINVFVDNRAVERHLARALRIYPGRTNLAVFMIGDLKPDKYALELVGSGPDWKAAVYDLSDKGTIITKGSDKPLPERQWIEASTMLAQLVVAPPVGCERGKLDVRVTKRSSQKTAVVEFDLDPSAQGPGCYCL